MSSRMNKEADSDWLSHSETLDEIKEESVEIKEEPVDDMADIKQEDPIYNPSDDIKYEIEKMTDFAGVKEEESVLDGINTIENEAVEIKEEPIDSFYEDSKKEELSSLPIADIFCPSTGDSRALTIDFEMGLYSKSQIASPDPTKIQATKRITTNEPVKGTSVIYKCAFCDALIKTGDKMDIHVRSMHPGELEQIRQLQKCDYCDKYYKMGSGMEKHMRSSHLEAWQRLYSDEQLAKDWNLPISTAEIADISQSDFMKLLKKDSLTKPQREFIRKIRRREKKKVARKRRDLARPKHVCSWKNSSSLGYSNHH